MAGWPLDGPGWRMTPASGCRGRVRRRAWPPRTASDYPSA